MNEINSKQIYINNIKTVDVLPQSEIIRLCQIREAGKFARVQLINGVSSAEDRDELVRLILLEEDAFQKLVESNLRLVVSIARKYNANGLTELDLIQEGNIGLHEGILRYDWHKGFMFSTYLYWWIRKYISIAIQERSRTIKLPYHITTAISKINKTARDIEQEDYEYATAENISEKIDDIDSEKVKELIELGKHITYLHDSYIDGNDNEQERTTISIEPVEDVADIVLNNEMKELLAEAMDRNLTEKEKTLIRLRFGLEDGKFYSLQESGRRIGVTRENARKIEEKSIAKLKNDSILIEYGEK